MKRVMIYARIKGDSTLIWEPTLLVQFDTCQKYASQKEGWNITKEVYVVCEKPHLDDVPLGILYERICNQEIDVLLVSGLDRLSFDVELQRHLYYHCKRFDVILESVTDKVEDIFRTDT